MFFKIIASIKNESYIDSIRMKIDDKKTFPSSYYSEVPPKNDHGTGLCYFILFECKFMV